MKVKLQVWVKKEINDKLRELISQKYNFYEKGLLSNEVEQALQNWILAHTNAQKINKANPAPRIYKVWTEVRSALNREGYVQQVTLRELKRVIALVRGSDERTVKKWLNLFARFKLIKEIAPQVYEII